MMSKSGDEFQISQYRLNIRKIEKTCLFELSWGQGQQLEAQLKYPPRLTARYQEWQRIYLGFYKSELRGRVIGEGTMTSPGDFHAKLVQAEAVLLSEFHRWLRSVELFEIREKLAHNQTHHIDLFITCSPRELERLPWEAWEIRLATESRIRISRTPTNIRFSNYSRNKKHKKTRVLVIIGEDKNLDFELEKKELEKHNKQLKIELIVRNSDTSINELKAKIRSTLTKTQGWDVLLFFGHSNEAAIGGEIAIAPGASIFLQEIAPDLAIAQQRGLKFALFNSCCGLDLAETPIDLGFSQVAIMREPIHNQVAQEFFREFLRNLAAYKDVHDCLLAACDHLKLKQNLTYPSAYLVPSLFRHPGAELFRLNPSGWKEKLTQLLPTQTEAIALSILLLLSLRQFPLQGWLLEKRQLIQAIYRDFTGQLETPEVNTSPTAPVLLVHIDRQSIQKAKLPYTEPIYRPYIARLVDRLVELDAKAIGIDYLFDLHHEEDDRVLNESFRKAISSQSPTWLVVTEVKDPEGPISTLRDIASPNWSLQGHINLLPANKNSNKNGTSWHMRLVPDSDFESPVPFSYFLALAHPLTRKNSQALPKPNGSSQTPFSSQIEPNLSNLLPSTATFSSFSPRNQITQFFYKHVKQIWLYPLVDLSIPPHRIYDRLPAWKLLELNGLPTSIASQAVLIAPGGYYDAGIGDHSDNFPLPNAMKYWRSRSDPIDPRLELTGGEIHTYMVHHFLNDRLLIPIPDLWMVGVAILLGKGTVGIWLQNRNDRQGKRGKLVGCFLVGSGASIVYGLFSLQAYINLGLLFPWLLPIVTFHVYTFPILRK